MIEFFHVAVSPLNLPFTVLLIMVVLYWLIVILGAIDMDIEAEWMPDLDIDDPGVHRFHAAIAAYRGYAGYGDH